MNPVGSYVVLTWFKHLKRWQGHLLDGPVSSFSDASCKRPCLTHSSYRCKCLAPSLFTRSLKICTISKGCDSDHWLLCCRTFCCKWYENRLMLRTIELCLLNLNISDSPRLVLDHQCGECSWFWWIVSVDLPLCSFTRAPRVWTIQLEGTRLSLCMYLFAIRNQAFPFWENMNPWTRYNRSLFSVICV